MTYQEIREELLAIAAKGRTQSLDAMELSRARTLEGKLKAMGIAPRRVKLNLRRLGLSARRAPGAPPTAAEPAD